MQLLSINAMGGKHLGGRKDNVGTRTTVQRVDASMFNLESQGSLLPIMATRSWSSLPGGAAGLKKFN